MEHPEEDSNGPVSSTDDISQQLGGLHIKEKPSSRNKKHTPPAALTIQTPPTYWAMQNQLLSSLSMAAPNNEKSYLFESLQRQQGRSERLSHALSNVEVRLASVQSKGEARKLRKEASLLKSKIAESRKQEQLIMLRLNDIHNEDLCRGGLYQPPSAGFVPYAATPGWAPYSPSQLWSPMAMSMASPVHQPVSPLTPMSAGIYQPAPIQPSPMHSPFWLAAYQYPILSPMMATEPSLYLETNMQSPYVPEAMLSGPSRRGSDAPRAKENRHKGTKSADFGPTQQGVRLGRRWSLADEFSPTPRDKRMSMPGLQTIWKNKEQEGED